VLGAVPPPPLPPLVLLVTPVLLRRYC